MLQHTYDLPITERMKKYCLSEVRAKWKDFKYLLNKDYIKGKKQEEDPCKGYLISSEEWQAFVASRQDPKFLVNYLVYKFHISRCSFHYIYTNKLVLLLYL